MAYTNFPNGVESAVGFVGPVNGAIGATTPAAATVTTLNATGNVTLGSDQSDTITINALATIPLAALPEYADQAAAAAALGAGRLFRFATTGAIGVALT